MRYRERDREGEMGWRGAERVGVHMFVCVCVCVRASTCKDIHVQHVCVCVEGGGGRGTGRSEYTGKFTLQTYNTKSVSVPLCQDFVRGGWPGHNQQTLLQL